MFDRNEQSVPVDKHKALQEYSGISWGKAKLFKWFDWQIFAIGNGARAFWITQRRPDLWSGDEIQPRIS